MEVTNLFAAFSKAFAEIEGATKGEMNPHFKKSYADLSNVVAAIKPALTKHGLFFFQKMLEREGGACVETFVGHSSGETMSFGELFIPAEKRDAQKYGSALSYARRYSLMTAFGVCPEDDDGNAASQPQQAPQRQQPQNKPAKDTNGPIDEATYITVRNTIEAKGHNLAEFCKANGIESLMNLKWSELDMVRAKLKGN